MQYILTEDEWKKLQAQKSAPSGKPSEAKAIRKYKERIKDAIADASKKNRFTFQLNRTSSQLEMSQATFDIIAKLLDDCEVEY